MKEFKMIAKTFKGLEEVLAGELVELGANNVQLERRAVSFTGDKRLLYRANLCLRTASRVLVPITTFKAGDADAVYEQVKQIDWSQYMTLQTGFQIDATVYSDTFRHSRYVTYRVKDAIVDWWNEKEGKRPNVKLSNPDLSLNVHIANETVTLSLDSSGESLHKRGYRVANTEAPINEALAAGMLLMAGWKGETDFYDLMCGSGTLLIEAALIAQNIAPGIFRKGFAFEKWADFDKELFEDIYNDDSAERPFTHHIYGSDASFYAVQQALKNVKSAGQQRTIEVRQIRLQEIKRDNQTPALIMVNPPYGERLAHDKDVMRLYADMGTAFKHQFTGSTAWVISSNEDALKCIGLKPSKRIKLLNGELECWFNQYELFAGERKTFVANKTPKKANHGRTPHK
jgi:putative N6-adenine-specific DNA methylase